MNRRRRELLSVANSLISPVMAARHQRAVRDGANDWTAAPGLAIRNEGAQRDLMI